jgi:iron complex outermembrane receptor protein
MKLSKVHVAIAAALSGACVVPMHRASAQEGLEEIVVTATRREQNLQDVPISIVAITGNTLEMRGLENLERVSQGVPNVIITGGGGGTGGTNFRMRGIPQVGTYIDGIWQVGTSGFLVNEFVDLDRIEVLRGPQGTSFGRDSTGGAIRIWTKRPDEELGGDVTATTGSYGRRDVKGVLNLPLGDKVRTRFTGASLYRDGYIQSLTTGESGGGVDEQIFRGDIVIDATDKLSFRINYQTDSNRFTEPRIQDAMFRTYDDPAQGWGKMPEFYTYVGVDRRGNPVEPFFDPHYQWAGYPGGVVGKYQNRSGTTLPNRYETDQASLDVTWQLSDKMKLEFLTAGTRQNSDSTVDWDNSQYDLVLDMNRSKLFMRSEEIQLSGGRDKVDWVAGVYYWDQTTRTRNGRWQLEEFQLGEFDVNNVLNSAACNPPGAIFYDPNTAVNGVDANGLKSGQLYPDATAFANMIPYTGCQSTYTSAVQGSYDVMNLAYTDGYAAFGEATLHLTDTLDLTLGVRYHNQSGYSQNKAKIPGVTAPKPLLPTQYHVGDAFIGTNNGAAPPFQFDKVTSKVALQKQFRDNLMGYVSYSEGFNSGGVSRPNIRGVPTPFPYKPSTLKNTEIGMRSDLANGKVRFNWTVFNTIWADLQAAGVVFDPITGEQIPTLVTTNVGEAEAKGVEVELTFVPTDNLAINLGLGLLDTAYTKIAPGTMNGHLPFTTGLEFQDAPDSSYTIGLTHTADFKSGATLTTRIDYNYQGQFWRSEPFLRVTGYAAVPPGFEESGNWGVMNLRFTYEPADKKWAASFFGTNITNEYMINSGFFHGIWGYDFATVGRPREAGVSLTYRF